MQSAEIESEGDNSKTSKVKFKKTEKYYSKKKRHIKPKKNKVHVSNTQLTNNKKEKRDSLKKIRTNKSLIRRSEYPSQIYSTANALTWPISYDSYTFKEKTQTIKIIPVSGLEEVGANCTIIETEDDILIIDLGIGFPENNLLGIDGLVPNLKYLDDKKSKIRGVIITHGHTDHIGGLPYIYESIGSPIIYAPHLAAEMIKEKSKELGIAHIKIQKIDGNSVYYLGKLRISHFRMTHTIMDNYGVCVDTPLGKIVHTSDYKFDLTPYKEPPSDYSKLTKMGDEGVVVVLDESTNAKIQGWAPSETTIAYDLENIIRDASGRLIIGLFSTMISRIKQIAEISSKYGKKIAISGKSLASNVKIAHRLGYIDVNSSTFIDIEKIHKYSDDSLVILTTGSQGEPNAALTKIALGEHPHVTLKPNDVVVFSSSKIPGNEQKIDKLINLISAHKCKVITSDTLTLHATGHGFSEDHKLMLQLLRPRFVMPVHGDQSMLVANKENAQKIGYKSDEIILAKNGDIIEINNTGWSKIGNIDSKPFWLENEKIHTFNEETVNERKIIAEEGLIMCIIQAHSTSEVRYNRSNINLVFKGVLIEKLENEIVPHIINALNEIAQNHPENHNKNNLKTFITSIIKKYLKEKYNKTPLIEVIVLSNLSNQNNHQSNQ